jgi:DNA gyrase subunit A
MDTTFTDEKLTRRDVADIISANMEEYAILTIRSRAIPDARDGLKPVQRRVLFAMSELGLDSNKPYKKSARVVGEVLGKYHPHGDQSVYDAMVRMAQDFSMRHVLVDGQGNFGSVDGDSPAAMRYTEARLSPLGESIMEDLDKETVNWRGNFDDTLKEPTVMPARVPNLLLNGASGIAVGMSTNILPHNLTEICDAVIYLAKRWSEEKRKKVTVDELMKIIPGPDLPTGGLLYRYRVDPDGTPIDMIRKMYETGRSVLVNQAQIDIQPIGGGKNQIIVTALPYQIQKNTIMERVAAVREKLPGIVDAADESDRSGMRVVFETGRGVDPNEAMEALLTYTSLRSSLSVNTLALVKEVNNGLVPHLMSLREMLEVFIEHRLEVIIRRSQFDLNRAQSRLHIVEALLKALNVIDKVVSIIRKSENDDTARIEIMKALKIDQEQAQAILDMPLRRLNSLNRFKLEGEDKELREKVSHLSSLIRSQDLQLETVIQETNEIKQKYPSPRKTVIVDSVEGHKAVVTASELQIPLAPQVVYITAGGKLRRCDQQDFKAPKIGKLNDTVVKQVTLQPNDNVLIVSSKGRMWCANVGKLDENMSFSDLGLDKGETIVFLGVHQDSDKKCLTLLTRQGNIKRTLLSDLKPRSDDEWSSVFGLDKGDELMFAGISQEKSLVAIFTAGNAAKKLDPRALIFEANKVNPQATPSAKGVAAIKMIDDDPLISATILDSIQDMYIVTGTREGYFKKVKLSDFPVQGRATQGVMSMKFSQPLVLATGLVCHKNAVLNIAVNETVVQIPMSILAESNRSSKGEKLTGIERVSAVFIAESGSPEAKPAKAAKKAAAEPAPVPAAPEPPAASQPTLLPTESAPAKKSSKTESAKSASAVPAKPASAPAPLEPPAKKRAKAEAPDSQPALPSAPAKKSSKAESAPPLPSPVPAKKPAKPASDPGETPKPAKKPKV